MIFGLDLDSLYLMAHLHPYNDISIPLRGELTLQHPCSFEAGILRDGRPLGVILDFNLNTDTVLNGNFMIQCFESKTYKTAILSRGSATRHQIYYGADGSAPYTYSLGFVREPTVSVHLPLAHCNVNEGEPVDPEVPYSERPTGVLLQVQGAKPTEARPKSAVARRDMLATYTPKAIPLIIPTADGSGLREYKGLFIDIQYYIQGYTNRKR